MGGVVGRLWSIARHLIPTIHEAFSPLRALVTLLPGDEIGNALPETLELFLPEDCKTVKCEIRKYDLKENATAVEDQISVDSFLDLGVPVQRPKIEPSGAEVMAVEVPVAVKKEKTITDAFSDLHSLDQLRAFLKQETQMRKVSKKTCTTAKLKQEEWKNLKVEVFKAMNEKIPNKSLKLCRKILRKALA